jgi:hypothetical protein
MPRMSIFQEFWEFIKVKKRYWLAPLILIFLILGMFIVFAQNSAVAPFIYTLF